VGFEAAPVLKKPGQRADAPARAAGRRQQTTRPTARAARRARVELREDFDRAGAGGRRLLGPLEGSFCNRGFFWEPIARVDRLCRCRKDALLCGRAPAGGRCVYGKESFTPESVRQDETRPWQEGEFFHGGGLHRIRYKECAEVFWRKGGGRRPLRLLVIAPTGYRLHVGGRLLYRQPAYLLTTDLHTPAAELITAYLDHWQIEINHREEKSTLGVGQAQVRNERSVPRQPAFVVAIYALLLLAALRAYGPERTGDYLPPPKWARGHRRPSCLEIIALLRAQAVAQPEKLQLFGIETSALNLVLKAAA
jgi:hypothetical protein